MLCYIDRWDIPLSELQRCSWLSERWQQISMCCSLYLTLDQQVVFSVARITEVANLPLRMWSSSKASTSIYLGSWTGSWTQVQGAQSWCYTTELSTYPLQNNIIVTWSDSTLPIDLRFHLSPPVRFLCQCSISTDTVHNCFYFWVTFTANITLPIFLRFHLPCLMTLLWG